MERLLLAMTLNLIFRFIFFYFFCDVATYYK